MKLADTIADLFFAGPIPRNDGLTGACLTAGDHLAKFLNAAGRSPKLYRREEYHLSEQGREWMGEVIATTILLVDLLPGEKSLRQKAIASLEKYAAKLK
jgi:hypothetical protein